MSHLVWSNTNCTKVTHSTLFFPTKGKYAHFTETVASIIHRGDAGYKDQQRFHGITWRSRTERKAIPSQNTTSTARNSTPDRKSSTPCSTPKHRKPTTASRTLSRRDRTDTSSSRATCFVDFSQHRFHLLQVLLGYQLLPVSQKSLRHLVHRHLEPLGITLSLNTRSFLVFQSVHDALHIRNINWISLSRDFCSTH